MSDLIISTSDATFASDVLESSVPVLVDFWAEWCGPCKAIAPALAELAKDFEGKVTVAKLNIDENQNVPSQFGIRSIPTLLLFNNGQVQSQQVGAVSKTKLTEFLNTNLDVKQ